MSQAPSIAADEHPNEALPPGTQLGEFELLRTIGVGGTGIVYLAMDQSLQRRVALKEYMPTSLASRSGATAVVVKSERHRDTFEVGRKSFINEARLLATFDHPSLIKVYRFWEANGTAYMVMPFLDGQTLKDMLRRRSEPPDEGFLLPLLDQLTGALLVMHEQQCYHRDIAPDNVMQLPSGRWLLLDFGAARRVIGDMTQALTVILKPGYAPVEQYAEIPGMQQGAWTDIYALAALVHYAITGRTPPPSVGRLVNDSYQPLSESQRGRYGAGFLAAIDAGLAVLPQERPQSVQALREALGLRASTGGEPVVTVAPPYPRQSAPPAVASQAGNRRTATPEAAALRSVATWLLAPLLGIGAALAWIWRSLVTAWGGQSSGPPCAPPAAASMPTPRRERTDSPNAPEPDGRTQIRPRGAPQPKLPAPTDEDAGHTVILSAAAPLDGPPQVQLVVTDSADRSSIGTVHRVNSGRLVIGRRESAGMRLADRQASAEHAAIERVAGGYCVIDLGSSNGTFLNGRRLPALQREPLWLGAALQIGDTVLSFVRQGEMSPRDLSGGEIAGMYRLERCMRQSPKGAVYAAHQLRSRTNVAIKLLAAEVVSYPGYREQFERVVAAARRLQHPNICPLLDSGHADVQTSDESWPTTYLCYPLLSGGNLADRLADRHPLAQQKVISWLRAIAAALQHAHRQGLVHGDLKPSAICFDGDANVYVTDFTLAGATGEGSAHMGSPPYMSPEQWERTPLSASSDLFALAAMAYKMLTGALPFEGQQDPRVRERNFRLGPIDAHEEALRHAWPALSPAVSKVLRRGLAINAHARQESVQAFVDALSSALDQGPSGGSPPVFLSYQRGPGSTPLVHLLRRELNERYQIDCFLDSQEEGGAGSFPEGIERAVSECRVFVCLLAATTLDSEWVRREVQIAHQHGRLMIPVLLQSFSAPAAPLADEPAIHSLLHSKGEQLDDVHGALLEDGVARVIRRVRDTLARPDSA